VLSGRGGTLSRSIARLRRRRGKRKERVRRFRQLHESVKEAREGGESQREGAVFICRKCTQPTRATRKKTETKEKIGGTVRGPRLVRLVKPSLKRKKQRRQITHHFRHIQTEDSGIKGRAGPGAGGSGQNKEKGARGRNKGLTGERGVHLWVDFPRTIPGPFSEEKAEGSGKNQRHPETGQCLVGRGRATLPADRPLPERRNAGGKGEKKGNCQNSVTRNSESRTRVMFI